MSNTSEQPTSFNTHNVVKKLVAKGFRETQAEGIVNAILEGRNSDFRQFATKEQVNKLKIELKSDISDVRTEVNELRGETKAGFERLKAETGISIEKLRTEIEKAKLSAILIIGSLIVASTTIIGALIKYFSLH